MDSMGYMDGMSMYEHWLNIFPSNHTRKEHHDRFHRNCFYSGRPKHAPHLKARQRCKIMGFEVYMLIHITYIALEILGLPHLPIYKAITIGVKGPCITCIYFG